jgi:ligand-binding sensor domain-containing protein
LTALAANARACVPAAVIFTLSAALVPSAASAAGLDPRKAVTQYNLDAWTTASGLPQNTITAITQTEDGYLWIGSFGGLARFDGRPLRGVRQEHDAGAAQQRRPCPPRRPQRRPLGRHQRRRPHLAEGRHGPDLRHGDGLGADVVRSLFQDSQGRVWAGTNGGLSLLEGERFRNWNAASGFTSTVVRAIREDAKGALWIGTNGDGLFRMQDGPVHAFHPEGRPAQRPHLLPRLRQGRGPVGGD